MNNKTTAEYPLFIEDILRSFDLFDNYLLNFPTRKRLGKNGTTRTTKQSANYTAKLSDFVWRAVSLVFVILKPIKPTVIGVGEGVFRVDCVLSRCV